MGISVEELQRRAQEAAAYAEYGLNWSSPGYNPDLVVGHVERFSKVWDRYPRIVLCVYEGDLAAAARDTDEQVVARVCGSEIARSIATIRMESYVDRLDPQVHP